MEPSSSTDPSGREAATSRPGQAAASIAEDLKQEGKARAQTGLRSAADTTDSIAESVGDLARSLKDGDQQRLGGYIEDAATSLGRVAERIRGASIDELASEVQDAARRNPGLFLLGSVVVGFGAARFLKASDSRIRDGASPRHADARRHGDTERHRDAQRHDDRGRYDPYASDPYDSDPYDSDPYGSDPDISDISDPYGSDPYGTDPHVTAPAGQGGIARSSGSAATTEASPAAEGRTGTAGGSPFGTHRAGDGQFSRAAGSAGSPSTDRPRSDPTHDISRTSDAGQSGGSGEGSSGMTPSPPTRPTQRTDDKKEGEA